MKHQPGFLIVALAAAGIFGIVALAGGDWLPGTIIVAAAVIGLATQILAVALDLGRPSGAPGRER